jgi:hypothetical protein
MSFTAVGASAAVKRSTVQQWSEPPCIISAGEPEGWRLERGINIKISRKAGWMK